MSVITTASFGSFNAILEGIDNHSGREALSDTVNLALACARVSLTTVIDFVNANLDWLSVDDRVVFTMAIMDRHRDGIGWVDFE